MRERKESVSCWVSKKEKLRLKELAFSKGMSLSAYVKFVLEGPLKEDWSPKLTVLDEIEEKTRPIKICTTESEAAALKRVSLQRGQNVQTVVIAAIREFLLSKPQIDEKTKKQIVDSTLAINKVGTNLNQVARVLNAQNKGGSITSEVIETAVSSVNSVNRKVLNHMKFIETILKEHYYRSKIDEREKS